MPGAYQICAFVSSFAVTNINMRTFMVLPYQFVSQKFDSNNIVEKGERAASRPRRDAANAHPSKVFTGHIGPCRY